MGVKAIKKAKTVGAIAIATGVMQRDIKNPLLWWLYPFLRFGSSAFKLFGLGFMHPVWNWMEHHLLNHKLKMRSENRIKKLVDENYLQVNKTVAPI